MIQNQELSQATGRKLNSFPKGKEQRGWTKIISTAYLSGQRKLSKLSFKILQNVTISIQGTGLREPEWMLGLRETRHYIDIFLRRWLKTINQ